MISYRIIMVYIVLFTTTSHAQLQINSDYPSKTYKCGLSFRMSAANTQNIIDEFGEPPIWIDDFLRAPRLRKWAINKAYEIALNIIKNYSNDIVFSKYIHSYAIEGHISSETIDSYCSWLGYYKSSVMKEWNAKWRDSYSLWDDEGWRRMHNKKLKTFLCAPNYCSLPLADSAVAAIKPVRRFIKFAEHDDVEYGIGENGITLATIRHCPNIELDKSFWEYEINSPKYRSAKSFNEIPHAAEEYEIYYINFFEIYPLLFDNGYFLIEPRQYETDRSPWANSLLDALVFIILHEFAHFEGFIRNNTTLMETSEMDKSESTCDNFAYSLFNTKHANYLLVHGLLEAISQKKAR